MGIKKHCGWFSHPLGRGGGSVLIAGLLCTGALVTGRPSEAVVQILPDMTVVQRTTTLMDPAAIRADPTVQGILAAFDRAERALQRQDLPSLMEFYAPAYNYHGLRVDSVHRIWGEVFEHYRDLSSTHLFSAMKVAGEGKDLRVEVTCTGGLYGTEMGTKKRVTLDSWFQEVHFLVKEQDGGWRFLGNKGDAPTAAPFSSSPHHPLF
ncbi:MAG: hypothetical protein KF814_07285 [Nitrospiraceae bacterium]|nr:hypothetical protein [Nitrospiraceae bacterium]